LTPESDTGNEQDPATGPQEHTALLAQTTEAASEQTEQQASEEPSQQATAQEQESPELPELPELPPGWTGPHPVVWGEPGFEGSRFSTDFQPQTKMKWFHYLKNKTVYERPTPAETGLPDEDPEKESKAPVAPVAKDRSLRRRLQVTPCAATHRRCIARVSQVT
jgi:hypothetical protein